MESTVRINVFLATKLGISRRKADQAISENAVRINGIAALLGQTVDPDRDRITVNGLEIKNQPITLVRLALYKPREYITARSDQWNRKTVTSLLPDGLKHLNPAGRLDYLSEGLLLLSNDGVFNYQFTHPKFQKEKEYILIFEDPISTDLIRGFKNGVELTEGLAKADTVHQISERTLQVTVHQGWNRQLRRMAAHYRYKIIKLVRTRIGQFTVDGLNPGEWREISGLLD